MYNYTPYYLRDLLFVWMNRIMKTFRKRVAQFLRDSSRGRLRCVCLNFVSNDNTSGAVYTPTKHAGVLATRVYDF